MKKKSKVMMMMLSELDWLELIHDEEGMLMSALFPSLTAMMPGYNLKLGDAGYDAIFSGEK